jgi:hypothetical protein
MSKNSGKFAGLLDSYLHQAGLPLRRVASQAGIPHQTLFNWLNGTQPRWHAALPKDLHRLGDTLGLADDEMTQLLRLTGCLAAAPPARSPSFEAQEVSMENSFRIPKGWFAGGDAPDKYEMGVDPAVFYENHPCVTIKAGPEPDAFAGLFQSFKVAEDSYAGKRLRFSAAVRSVDVENVAALFMRVAKSNGELSAFDNMHNRKITGSNDWAHHAIVLDVAQDANDICFGFFLGGQGQIWMADVCLETVDRDVPTTDIIEEIAPYFPVNLRFEE